MTRPSLEELREQHARVRPVFYQVRFTTDVVVAAADEYMALEAANELDLNNGEWDSQVVAVCTHHTFLDEARYRDAHTVVATQLGQLYPELRGLDADGVAALLLEQEPQRCEHTLDLFDSDVTSNE